MSEQQKQQEEEQARLIVESLYRTLHGYATKRDVEFLARELGVYNYIFSGEINEQKR